LCTPLNYLTAISGQAKLAILYLDNKKCEDAREAANVVADRVTQLSRIARDLLDPAKREHHPQSCDLNDLIRRLVQFVGRYHKFSGIAFELHLDEDLPEIWADATRMEQVLLNLYTNAANAMGSGMIVTRTCWDQAAQEVMVSVENMGPGLPEDIRRRIFRSGFTTRKEGYGFGLWICRRIVEHHGGSMGVISPLDEELGTGVNFWIRLPISAVSEQHR